MAASSIPVPLQIVNVDLAPERQHLLREKLAALFKVVNRKNPAAPRGLVYTVNGDGTALETLLRSNPDADAVFTGFNYAASASEKYKQALTTDQGVNDAVHVDPQLRYPLVAAFRKSLDRGLLRHRQLVLVADLREQIAQALRVHVPLEISVFTGEGRDEASQFLPIFAAERVSDKLDGPDPDPETFALGQISAIRLAGVEFSAVVHMPEVANRFELHEPSLLDTTRKLYRTESVRQVTVRERQREEKLAFVRGKRVLIVLEPDLDHVVGERLIFDKMHQLQRCHSLEEAERVLASGKSQGIVEHFETHGYDVVFDALKQEERDALMIAILGDRLGEFLGRELQTQRTHLPHLEDAEIDRILYQTPEPLIGALLKQLQAQSHERFLALVPAKIREPVILDFLSKAATVKAAWAGIAPAEQKEVLTHQAPLVLAHLNMVNSALFQKKFPTVRFEFARNYTSDSLAAMMKEERDATFALFQRSLAQAKIAPGAIAEQLSPPEIEACMAGYITSQPAEFYNRLSPLVRKQLWVTVGEGYRDHIDKALHFLDKVEIVKGNKDVALGLLFGMTPFQTHLKSAERRELAATVFLALKRTNQGESKTALLRKMLSSDEWKARRIAGVPCLLADPEQINLYKKLADKVEGLEFVFDSVVAMRADYERLKDRPPLKNATVTLVDELVDGRLMNLFAEGNFSSEDYAKFSATVEQQIRALRDQLTARETEDPLGVYILESMQMLNAMADQAMQGATAQQQLDAIDQRLAVRKRLETGMRSHLEKIREFLERGEQQLAELDSKAAHAEQLVGVQTEATEQALEQARGLMQEFQRLQQIQTGATAEKRKVALAQKELSLEFFRLIQPLLLERIKRWPAPIDALLQKLRGRARIPESAARRVIFRFTDEEIERIMRHRIVFCTRDEILMQFIATCLEIDHLEESLFSMATRETLPDKIDILFYGPGYTAEDFDGRVKRRRMVAFADESFHKRLQANEALKARTKTVLTKVTAELGTKQAALEAAGTALKQQQAKQGKLQGALSTITGQRRKLAQRMEVQRDKRHHFEGELEMLQQRFEEVDRRFEALREHVSELAGEGSAATQLAGDGEGLAGGLRDELVAINKELARMFYIKSVKDAGAEISRGTQRGILERMESRERYDFKKHPFRKLIVADDGSILARNMKTAFVNACAQHFKVREMAVEDVTLHNLDGRAEVADTKDYPFIAVLAGEPEDEYGDLRRIVRKVRNRMPQTYQLILAPMGELAKLDHASGTFENLRSIKDHGALVNASLGDYTVPGAMLQILQEKAPLA